MNRKNNSKLQGYQVREMEIQEDGRPVKKGVVVSGPSLAPGERIYKTAGSALRSYQALAALVLLALLAGCANTTTTTFSRGPGGEIRVESPKDVRITGLEAQLPDGTRVKIRSLTSRSNPAATSAQGAREAENLRAGAELAGKVTEGAARGAVKGVLP